MGELSDGRRLQGKTALIIGAGASGPGWGNGKATAVLFGRHGAQVFAVDRNREAWSETVDIIRSEGGIAEGLTADVTDPSGVEAMVASALGLWGHIDVLHYNVGIVELGGPVETLSDTWQRILDVNLSGLYLTLKQVLPAMQRQKSGSIVAVSSLAAIRWPGFPQAAYVASKAGVIGLTQNVALQYAAHGIRANVILPGLMDTPMVVNSLTTAYEGDVETMLSKRHAQSPTGQMGDAWDIAHAALFLASDEARYVNGVTLPVDGGLSLRFA